MVSGIAAGFFVLSSGRKLPEVNLWLGFIRQVLILQPLTER